MNLLFIGALVGLLIGTLIGAAYDFWRVSRIVEHTVLEYRVKEEEDRKKRLQKFIDETGGGEE